VSTRTPERATPRSQGAKRAAVGGREEADRRDERRGRTSCTPPADSPPDPHTRGDLLSGVIFFVAARQQRWHSLKMMQKSVERTLDAPGATAPARWPEAVRLGRTFIHPAVDVLLIGGVLSLPVALVARAAGFQFDVNRMMPAILLLSYAHVTASLLRLYSKKGVVRSRPFLTIGFPILAAVATLALLLAGSRAMVRVQGVYVSWSAYHYAAQTFGLSIMYARRSGCRISDGEKQFLRAACLAPFVYAILGPNNGFALFIPPAIYGSPVLASLREGLRAILLLVIVAGPLGLAARKWRRHDALPLMSLVLVFTNALWWVVFVPTDAFIWAALSHGLQYLVIAIVFYAKDEGQATTGAARTSRPRGLAHHAVTFYVASAALAFALYYGGPALLGALSDRFSSVYTVMTIALMLNFHHVILDGFIWRSPAPASSPHRGPELR
jgi:hypothetical protein